MDQLTLSCPNCAQPVAESDRYCEECGIDLSTARAPGGFAAGSPGFEPDFGGPDDADDFHLATGTPFPAASPRTGGTGMPAASGHGSAAGTPGGAGAGHGGTAGAAHAAGVPGASGLGSAEGAPGGAGAALGSSVGAGTAGTLGAAGTPGGASPAFGGSVGAAHAAGVPGEAGLGSGAGAPSGAGAGQALGGPAGAGSAGTLGGAGVSGGAGLGSAAGAGQGLGPNAGAVGAAHAAGVAGGTVHDVAEGAPVPAGATGDFVLAAPVLATEAEQVGVPDPWSGVPSGDARICVGCGAQRIDTDGYCEVCGLAQPKPRDHQERALNGVCGVSDRGHRHHRNEDAFAVAATSRPDGGTAAVAVVCDGVSSATRPDDASQAAADSASETLLEALEAGEEPEAAMTQAIMAAAARVDALADEFEREPSRNSPACTIVSAVVTDGHVTIGWVGDSRAYWFPDARAGSRRLTVDDSWATRMVEAGLMSEAEAFADPRAHAITGWLGADAIEVEPHTLTFTPDAPGTVLICTDGLWNYAEAAADLAAVVPADARTEPLRAAQLLARYACDRGGHDNITVALLPIDPELAEPTLPDHAPTLVSESLDSPTIQLREGES